MDALAPTRHDRHALLARPAARRIARALEEAAAPMSAAEISRAVGRHHSGVRVQLAALERAGVVEGRMDPPTGRGRPIRRFRLVEDPDRRETEGHRELVRLLMRLVSRLGLGPDEMEHFGEQQGAGVPRPGGGVTELWAAFARLGFAPHPPEGDESADLILGRCPFVDGVEAPGGDLICILHRGLARGIAATAAPQVRVVGLVTEDPRRAGCRLRLSSAGVGRPGGDGAR